MCDACTLIWWFAHLGLEHYGIWWLLIFWWHLILILMTEGPYPASWTVLLYRGPKLYQWGNLLQLDADFGLRIFILVWTTSLIVVHYFFIWLRMQTLAWGSSSGCGQQAWWYCNISSSGSGKIRATSWRSSSMVGLLLTKLTLPETTSRADFVMDSRVSPADGIPRSCLGRTIRGWGRLHVLELGILAGSSSPCPELSLSWIQGCRQQMAYQEAAYEEPWGVEEGCMYWSLAS